LTIPTAVAITTATTRCFKVLVLVAQQNTFFEWGQQPLAAKAFLFCFFGFKW